MQRKHLDRWWTNYTRTFCWVWLLVTVNAARAQAPHFLWAKVFESPIQSAASAVVVDRYGNTYVTGSFRNQLHADHIVLTNGGVFLVKLDRDGHVLWARQGGTNRCEGRGIGLDSEGNPVVVCDFKNMGGTPLPIAGTNVSGTIILAKYDPDGNGLWARRVITTGTINLFGAFAVGRDGGSFFAIDATGTLTIGDTFVSSGFSQALVRCDANGDVAWFKLPSQQSGLRLLNFVDAALDSAGAAYLCGTFSNSVSFPPTNLVAAGQYDAMLVKYDRDGNLVWARRAGGSATNAADGATGLTLDAEENCLLAGAYTDAADFGDLALTNSVAGDCSFLAKYRPDGAIMWAKTVAQDGRPPAWVTSDNDNNVYHVRRYQSQSITWLKFNSNQEQEWSRSVPFWSQSHVCTDGWGNSYAVGSIDPGQTYDFDGITLSTTNFSAAVIAKLNTTIRPRLHMLGQTGTLQISWPLLIGGYHVETTDNLLDAESWIRDNNSITASGESNTVTIPQASGHKNYRLAK